MGEMRPVPDALGEIEQLDGLEISAGRPYERLCSNGV